eukprot:3857613-Pleurochrysis_carterae.AAC.1
MAIRKQNTLNCGIAVRNCIILPHSGRSVHQARTHSQYVNSVCGRNLIHLLFRLVHVQIDAAYARRNLPNAGGAGENDFFEISFGMYSAARFRGQGLGPLLAAIEGVIREMRSDQIEGRRRAYNEQNGKRPRGASGDE